MPQSGPGPFVRSARPALFSLLLGSVSAQGVARQSRGLLNLIFARFKVCDQRGLALLEFDLGVSDSGLELLIDCRNTSIEFFIQFCDTVSGFLVKSLEIGLRSINIGLDSLPCLCVGGIELSLQLLQLSVTRSNVTFNLFVDDGDAQFAEDDAASFFHFNIERRGPDFVNRSNNR